MGYLLPSVRVRRWDLGEVCAAVPRRRPLPMRSQYAWVAQLAEQRIRNAQVVGSSPTSGSRSEGVSAPSPRHFAQVLPNSNGGQVGQQGSLRIIRGPIRCHLHRDGMGPHQENDQDTTTAPTLPELWDEQRLADYLGVGPRFVRRLCEEGRIRFILVARHRRFDPTDVAAYIEAEKQGPDLDQAPVPRFSPATKRRPGRPIGSGRFGSARTGVR